MIITGAIGATLLSNAAMAADCNLALDGVATASNAASGYPANNAITDSVEDYWNMGAEPPQWLQIDLGEDLPVSGFTIVVQHASEFSEDVAVSYSNDSSTWTDVYTSTATLDDSDEHAADFDVATARYWRYTVNSSVSQSGVREFMLIGADCDSDGDISVDYGGTDCDDSDIDVYSGATELEDGVDNDCDSAIDEGTNAYDDDGDGYSENDGDCNDEDPNVRNNITELCNGIDDDCSGQVDEGYDDTDEDGIADCLESDTDGDGYSDTDCNPDDDTVNPGAPEIEDGQDNDCDGVSDEGTNAYDDDADGYSENEGDCDDTNDQVHEGIDEDGDINYSRDGVDNDCDGLTDEYNKGGDTGDTGSGDTGGIVPVFVGCNNDSGLKTGPGCSVAGASNSLVGIIIGLAVLIRRRR
jgi:hypothetical protein